MLSVEKALDWRNPAEEVTRSVKTEFNCTSKNSLSEYGIF